MKLPLFCCCLLLAAFSSTAQSSADSLLRMSIAQKRGNYTLPDPTPFAAGIRAEDTKRLVDTLASKAMQGRETGEPGQRLAAEFIAGEFKAAGLPPKGDRNTYLQDINLQKSSWADLSLKVGGQEYKNRVDYYLFSDYNPEQPLLKFKEVVFVGYGIEDSLYTDYAQADVRGKAVIFYDGEPQLADGKYVFTGEARRSGWSTDWQKKLQIAKKKGAVMAFIIDRNMEQNVKNTRRLLSSLGWRPVSTQDAKLAEKWPNSMFVSPALGQAILGKKAVKADEQMAELRNGRPLVAFKAKTKIELRLDKDINTLSGSNVIGFIEGSDPALKDEYLMVTAHYDHLGAPDSLVTYFGADDNASGTAGVIEIARAFAEAKKAGVGPKRSVVCMLVSGEEKGLLGSKFYVEYPLFSLKKTVADINVDMIGRVDDRHPGNPNYVYVIGSDRLSGDLHYINERANQTYTKLELDYKYNAKDDPNRYYERSDHYNFAEKGIPSIFYFNGVHADYHRPTDTPDKIDHAALAKRAQLAFYTAWDIANRPTRLVVDRKN